MSPIREQSFMKAVFHGLIAEELISPFPVLSLEEHDTVSLLVEQIRKADPNIKGVVLDLRNDPGGLLDASVAISIASHNCMGAWAIQAFGTDEQNRRFMPDVASGRRLVGFALTERNAGSDGSAMAASAELASDGAGYVIEGEKVWITNGTYADLFVVFAKTSQTSAHPRITAFLVEAGPGVIVTPAPPLVGTRGIGAGSLRLENVRVPFRNVLGEVGLGTPRHRGNRGRRMQAPATHEHRARNEPARVPPSHRRLRPDEGSHRPNDV